MNRNAEQMNGSILDLFELGRARPRSSITAALFAGVLATHALHAAEPVYAVVSPVGEDTVKMIAMAPRLDTLANKTVCMIGNDAFKINVTMPAIAEALREQHAGLRIVPYTDLPQAEPGAPQVLPPSLHDDFRSKGCNAVISGNGG
ncbi:MAG: hypothetical protein IT494_08875 [Gammaproteobacteria bacterium]|nr:hypothetical protein [Gammaproteobacteria bacterium]